MSAAPLKLNTSCRTSCEIAGLADLKIEVKARTYNTSRYCRSIGKSGGIGWPPPLRELSLTGPNGDVCQNTGE